VGNSMLKPGGLGSDLKKYHVTRKEWKVRNKIKSQRMSGRWGGKIARKEYKVIIFFIAIRAWTQVPKP
jgi:hypothetical protein